jgi:hypothetical protein
MDDIKIINLDAKDDCTRVADLMYRASDYVKMDTGKANNPGFVHSTLNDAPPVYGPDDRFLRGLERPDGTLAGFAGSIRHYPKAEMGCTIKYVIALYNVVLRRLVSLNVSLRFAHHKHNLAKSLILVVPPHGGWFPAQATTQSFCMQ